MPALIPTELPRSLAVARSDSPDVVQVFLFSDSSLQQVQFTNGKWSISDLGSSIANSSIADGPIGGVGWNSTAVRLYYLVDGDITEMESENLYGKWTTGSINAEYDYMDVVEDEI
jgi:hypothetical protein